MAGGFAAGRACGNHTVQLDCIVNVLRGTWSMLPHLKTHAASSQDDTSRPAVAFAECSAQTVLEVKVPRRVIN